MSNTPNNASVVFGPTDGGVADNWDGWLTQESNQFDAGVVDLNVKLQNTLTALTGSPSDPTVLADYQKALSEYTLYRNAQSTSVKTIKDVDSGIIQNFR